MPLLFSYGTLQQDKVQAATFGRLLRGRSDELPGFDMSQVPIADAHVVQTTGMTHYANARFTGRTSDRVAGTVFELTDDELAAADRYEAAARYARTAVRLSSGLDAWVYVRMDVPSAE